MISENVLCFEIAHILDFIPLKVISVGPGM